MNISHRLKSICEYIAYKTMADIGTDHGYVPIYALENSICEFVIACDINEGPLERALENIKTHKLQESIELRLANGLDKLKINEVETIVITGMGGILIKDILSKDAEIVENAKQLVLSPQGDDSIVRDFIEKNNYIIVRENMVFDEGKYYNIIDARNFTLYKDYKHEISGSLLSNPTDEYLSFLDTRMGQIDEIIEKLKKSCNGDKKISEFKHKKDFYNYCKEIALSCK